MRILAGAALSGALWGLCFGTTTWPWLAGVALVPLLVVLGDPRTSRRGAVVAGLVHGVVSWTVSIPWIVPTLITYGRLPAVLSGFLLLLFALFLALYRTLFTVLALPLARRLGVEGGGGWGARGRGVLAVAGLPALWVAAEWLRGTLFTGFPWNLAAYAWVDVPGALPAAAWVGPYGVSFLVVLANAGGLLAWRRRRLEPWIGMVLAVSLVLVLAARLSWGTAPVRYGERLIGSVMPGESIRIVQPNPQLGASPELQRRQYQEIVERSHAACSPGLLIWPESAAWPHTWDGSWELRRDLLALAARGCDVLINTPALAAGSEAADSEAAGTQAAGERLYNNSAFLITATGPAGRYDKRRLVPWGEYVPLEDVLPFVGRLARFAGRFAAGRTAGTLAWRGERLGVAVCYEVMFPELVAEQARGGATLLVNLSNDAWYGDSSAPRQLFRAARFRAAENRRVLLRAALTGISGVIDRRGEVRARMALGEAGVVRDRLPGSADLTPWARAPWLVPAASALLAVFAIFSCRRRPDGVRRDDPQDDHHDDQQVDQQEE